MELSRLKIDRSPRSRRRRGPPWVRWLVILAVLGGIGYALRTPLRRLVDRVALPKVQVARAAKTNPLAASAVSGTAANGYVVAARRAALSADISGRVVEMLVTEGSVVKQDQVVARLFSQEYLAAVTQSRARVEAAKRAVARAVAQENEQRATIATLQANVDAALARVASSQARIQDAEESEKLRKLEYDRADKLVKQGTETIAVFDAANTALQRARATLRAERAGKKTEEANVKFARAALGRGQAALVVATEAVAESKAQIPVFAAELAQAKALLSKTEVRAPFDGIIVLKDAEVGEVVSPNSQGAGSRGSVVTMVDFASLEVQVDLPETTLSQVQRGDTAAIYLDAYPTKRYDGRVDRIWPTANRQKGTVELRVKFDEPDDALRPEMGVRVVFSPETDKANETDEAALQSFVVVTSRAIVRIDGRPHVFVVERDRLRLQAVKTGAARGDRLVIEQGLRGDETVVVEPASDLEDGMRVRVESAR